ncbi:MAG: tRNA (adenosine(37)-N6)-dimethylallyltransferase MiaA [Rhodocyclales bacterium]|nr:tRNA (adenosine(37)-N6)-dimethylallyltransferase MiaA [Rhodocyclales bacterium]
MHIPPPPKGEIAPPPLIPWLLGPTAGGKTALALRLAERFPLEIVSVDSALVYRGMDIGTAKPTPQERARVPHHLIDLVEPEEAYGAARFLTDALAAIEEIRARGRLPLLVGGTMLYFKALREGLSDLPPADPRLRAELDARAAREGWPALHAELARLDPQAAARLAPTDAQRIQRALEIVLLTGEPLAARYARRSAPTPSHRWLPLALVPTDRARLHQSIAERFHTMLQAGFIEEVMRLRQRPRLTLAHPSMRAVGYRQVWQYLEGTIGREAMIDAGIAATRQLAKRQLTWLRQFGEVWPELRRFDPFAPDTPQRLAAALEGAL